MRSVQKLIDKCANDGWITVLYQTKPSHTTYLVYIDNTTGIEHRHDARQFANHMNGIARRAENLTL